MQSSKEILSSSTSSIVSRIKDLTMDDQKQESKEGKEDIRSQVKQFIKKPSQNCSNDELIKGVNQVIQLLEKNAPSILIELLEECQREDEEEAGFAVAGTYYLEDLLDKMKNNPQHKVVFFKQCMAVLVSECVYAIADMHRFMASVPKECYSEAMECILASRMDKIFSTNSSPDDTLRVLTETYQTYREEITKAYEKIFNKPDQPVAEYKPK